MLVAMPLGTLVKLVLALVVALTVVVVLVSGLGTQDTNVPRDTPPTADIRADR